MTFRVLYVCTGNICRSPMAERLFEAWKDIRIDAVATSCGIAALVGHGIDDSSASAMARMGVDPGDHKAIMYTDDQALDADLILTAGREQRDYILGRLPQVHRKTFTMKEFARLVQEIPGEMDPWFKVAASAARRGRSEPVDAEQDDVPDPFQGSIIRAKVISEDVSATVQQTLNALGFSKRQVVVQ